MALVNASRIGNISVVRKLIADGEDLEQTEEAAWEGDEDGTTALMWASMNSHQDVVELLLTSGANPEARDEDQMTALMLAGMEGHREVIWKLINAKAEVNAQDSDGRTALHHSAMYGHAAVVGLLLSADADIEVKDTAGYTPLMTAKLDDYYIVMGMLLSCGAQPRLPSGEMTKEEIDEATLRYSDWVGSEVFDRLDVHNLEELDSYLTAHSGDSSHLSSKKLEARGAEAEALKQINLALAARDAERLTKAITYAEEVSDKYDGFVHAHYVEEARDSLQTMAYENEKREGDKVNTIHDSDDTGKRKRNDHHTSGFDNCSDDDIDDDSDNDEDDIDLEEEEMKLLDPHLQQAPTIWKDDKGQEWPLGLVPGSSILGSLQNPSLIFSLY